MPQPIKIPVPKKGVIRVFDRSDQPAESTWNALNVVPYDRQGRLRTGQRPGTVRLQNAVLATAPVMQLSQVATIVASANVGANNLVYEEIFAYTNNASFGAAPQPWSVDGSRNGGITNTWAKISNPPGSVTSLTKLGTAGQTDTNAVYTGALALGTFYKLKMNVAVSTAATSSSYSVLFRYDGPNFIGLQVSLSTSNNGTTSVFNMVDPGVATLATVAGPANWTDGQVFTIEVRVNGNVLQGWLNGVQQFSITAANRNTKSSVGFAVSGSGVALPNAAVSDYRIYAGAQPSFRQNNLVAVCNQSVFIGDISLLNLAGSGSGIVAQSVVPQIVYTQGFGYIVDGTSILKLDIANKGMVAYAATAGTAPVGCTIAAVYRDRLVLAAPLSAPQNFFFSRVGVPTDWDYSQTDPAAAFAGNASTAGHIGEPITALIPFNDDVLAIGGDHNLWLMRGDPADGGSIDLVSDAIGVYGPNAWCKDPSGIVYFVGPGGLYKMAPGSPPQIVSNQSYSQFFASIDRTNNYITMAWDRDRFGCYIFVTPIAGISTAGTHLFYDSRNEGLWPIQFPTTHGPVSSLVYDGDVGTQRVVLLGGTAGLIQKLSSTALDDDGTAITSLLSLGPIQPAQPAGDAVVTGVDITLGENSGSDATTAINAVWTLKGGKSAYEVTEDTPRRIAAGVFVYPGRQLTRHVRIRGGWFALEISNNTVDTYWSLEQVTLHVEGAGKQR